MPGKQIIIKVALSVLLVFLVLFPNVFLALEQVSREIGGLESLVNPYEEGVIRLAEEANSSKNSPEDYVLRKIPYASDYDVYYNLEYWASPGETLKSGKGDCEDRALLVKSVQKYLRINSTLVIQKDHVYVQRDNLAYGGISQTESYPEAIWNIITGIPLLRKIVIIAGLLAIWHQNLKKFYIAAR